MDFQSQLALYREQFSRREAEKAQPNTEESRQEIMWEDELPMMQPQGVQLDPALVATELENVDILRDNDNRFSGDEMQDEEAYRQYLMGNETFQEHSASMEQVLQEIIERAKDPNDPLTAEEANELFANTMQEQFGQYFQ